MDGADEIDNDQAELKAARARLRAFAGLVAEAVESIDIPETFLEGERAGRCVLATDRMLSQLYEAPRPEAYRVQLPGSIGLKAAKSAAKSSNASRFDDDEDDEDYEPTGEEYKAVLAFRLDHIVRSRARQSGHWNDGHPYDPADPDYGCIYQNFAIPGFDPLDGLVPADRFALAHARKAGDPIAPP